MDEEKINALKQRYRLAQTSELIRFLLTNEYERIRENIPVARTRRSS